MERKNSKANVLMKVKFHIRKSIQANNFYYFILKYKTMYDLRKKSKSPYVDFFLICIKKDKTKRTKFLENSRTRIEFFTFLAINYIKPCTSSSEIGKGG